MVAILRNADQTIKTYSERGEDFILQAGESLELMEMSFSAYASRLRISAGGKRGESLTLPGGTREVEIEVDCPGEERVTLEIDQETREVILMEGRARFTLAVEDGRTYCIRPHDRVRYCAGGEAFMAVVVK